MCRARWLGFLMATVTATACGCSREPEQRGPIPPTSGTPAVTVVPATTATSKATATAPAPSPAASGAFGFDRVHESCNSFSAHITNPARTAWLDVRVDVKGLGLGAGAHRLTIDGQKVALEIRVLAAAHVGEWACTDIGGGPPCPRNHARGA